jgi:hypothetical protein
LVEELGRSESDLSGLDLLVIQIDGIHMDEDMILVAAIGVDAKGDKHPLGLMVPPAAFPTLAVFPTAMFACILSISATVRLRTDRDNRR